MWMSRARYRQPSRVRDTARESTTGEDSNGKKLAKRMPTHPDLTVFRSRPTNAGGVNTTEEGRGAAYPFSV